jgi:hypothetical protein
MKITGIEGVICMNCPNCGSKLSENSYGDLCCPIDGIIFYHKEEKSTEDNIDYQEYKNYSRYIG